MSKRDRGDRIFAYAGGLTSGQTHLTFSRHGVYNLISTSTGGSVQRHSGCSLVDPTCELRGTRHLGAPSLHTRAADRGGPGTGQPAREQPRSCRVRTGGRARLRAYRGQRTHDLPPRPPPASRVGLRTLCAPGRVLPPHCSSPRTLPSCRQICARVSQPTGACSPYILGAIWSMICRLGIDAAIALMVHCRLGLDDAALGLVRTVRVNDPDAFSGAQQGQALYSAFHAKLALLYTKRFYITVPSPGQ
jgi:hypothetical protein